MSAICSLNPLDCSVPRDERREQKRDFSGVVVIDISGSLRDAAGCTKQVEDIALGVAAGRGSPPLKIKPAVISYLTMRFLLPM